MGRRRRGERGRGGPTFLNCSRIETTRSMTRMTTTGTVTARQKTGKKSAPKLASKLIPMVHGRWPQSSETSTAAAMPIIGTPCQKMCDAALCQRTVR